MQDALIRLTDYWAGRGCLVTQPMNTEVGAGTLNPATALRVLGPEPWRVAYVEPSVRPDDSRYGDNPNRLQTHTQFQVILKPEPGDAQELYLGSLRALGIDLDAHDVRFVEDNWASPALGAWGLGWEVWLDGLEITQFTYFQQSGGLTLDPVSVEITYGMERIIMALQGVSHFKDIAYAPGISYGEAFGQSEYEMSRYYLDDADIETNRQLFEAYATEARRMLDARLPVPAHSYVLKCSHAFNVLDSRGAIGTTERARAFARMRGLAHEVAELWVERRAELDHPLGDAAIKAPAASETSSALPEISGDGTFALEIGVEELPPHEVAPTAEHVARALVEGLEETGLHADESVVETYATPRRIIAVVTALHAREPDREQVVKGPRLSAAYDADGNPTKALQGFARGQGVAPSDVGTVTLGDVEYAGLVRTVTGRPAAQVLADLVPRLVKGLRADRNMRWNAPGLSFSRPIRWLVALLNEHVVPVTVAGMTTGRDTRVHRTADRPLVSVPHAAELISTLRANGIEPDIARRRSRIVEAAGPLARSVDGAIDLPAEHALVEEIVNLVEEPTAVLGSFDESYLTLPEEILTTVMKKHQRYLPVRSSTGRLLPYFVTVANGACDTEAVAAGNAAVLRARYEDAAFFFQHDLRSKPEQLKGGLEKLTFADRLGSMADRATRIRAIANELASRVDLSNEEFEVLRRAGKLAKFDLATSMVIELSSLAGTMAREYARRAGEDEAVAQALYEMELPRSAGDALPTGVAGSLLAVADRLDLLAGLFAVGSAPTGGSDPFGLRRAALALTAILRTNPRLAAVTVDEGLEIAAHNQLVEVTPEALAEANRFVARRLEQALIDEGHPVQVVRAVMPHAGSPAYAERAAGDLGKLLGDDRFQRLTTALQRVLRIVPEGTRPEYDPELFTEPAEQRLYDTFVRVRAELPRYATLPEFTAAALPLAEPIDTYFDDVMVMDKDPGVRANRLGFLADIRDLVTILDWPQIA
ncbi:glycine--tRNA ligase [Actinomadura rudentiformis]|uniref:Multifunctional fusion protein n=1 Tax=Actinomadura rudentiformis TaxID=359158 RepID=A0A6H9YQK0_9ACTN|nr:glycine--tRNA ligase [Actinomadura rudentiformis]KAB2343144.1 glycine--tRNA ligase [Actinomadura rudentiformis]